MSEVGLFQYTQGMQDLLKAKQFAETIHEPVILTTSLTVLSNLYLHLSAVAEAERAADQALAACPPRSPQLIGLLIQKGRLTARSGEVDQAIPLFRQSIALANKMKNPSLEGIGWRTLGTYLLRAGRLSEAGTAFDNALRLGLEAKDPAISVTYASLAEFQLTRDNEKAALKYIDQAFESYRPDRAAFPVWSFHYTRGRALAAAHRLKPALDEFRLALTSIQNSGWHKLPADALRVSSNVGVRDVYSAFINTAATLYNQTHDPALLAESFTVAEADRAIALRRTAAGRARSRRRLPPTYFETLAALQAHYAENYRNPSPDAQDRAADLRLRLTEMEAAAGMDDSLSANPNLDAIAHRLAPTQAVLSFHTGPKHSYLWTLSKDRLTVHLLPPAPQLEQRVQAFRRAISNPSADLSHLSAGLYADLFNALPGPVRNAPDWLILADGPLFDLPFAALRLAPNGPHLIEQHTLQFLPGLWTFDDRTTHRAGATWAGPFVGVGDPIYNPYDDRRPFLARSLFRFKTAVKKDANLVLPRLINTATEIRACANAASPGKARILLGPDASWPTVLSSLKDQPATLHFATHVVPSPDNPRESLLALSIEPDGAPQLLTPELIAANDVGSRLVVLSGCRSGSGEIKPGEGLMGLTRAWLLAGTQSVIATYWPTLDDSGQLLAAFYESAKSQPTPKALQAAQVRMIHSKDFRAEPSYWAAPFISSRGLY